VCELLRKECDRIGVRRRLLQVDELQLVLLGEGDPDLPLAGEAERDDDLPEPLARLLLDAERVLELLVGQQARRREQRAEGSPAELDVSRVQSVVLVAQRWYFVIGSSPWELEKGLPRGRRRERLDVEYSRSYSTRKDAPMPDLRSLSTGTKIVLGAAILLLISMFFNWQEVSVEVSGVEVASAGQNAWHGFWGVVMGLLTLAMIAWVGAQLLNVKLPDLPVPARTITLALGALIFAFALIKNLVDDYSTFWSYIGVVLAAAVAVGAWLRSQEPELVAAPTATPPTPETP
jgi:hypothetical protein